MSLTRFEKYKIAYRAAVVSGIFAALVATLLLVDFTRRVAEDPLNSPQYLDLRAELKNSPQDAALRESLRQVDQTLREQYFDRRRYALWGAWLLLGGSLLSLGLGKYATTLRRRLPHPDLGGRTDRDVEQLDRRIAHTAVVAFVGLAATIAVGFYLGLPSQISSELVESQSLAAANGSPSALNADGVGAQSSEESEVPDAPVLPELPSDAPTIEQLKENWPRFRGYDGLAVVTDANVPTEWDVESGEGILWKSEVPLPGNNSPIVWGDRVFLSGATEETREVICFDADTGELLWQTAVPSTPESTAEVPKVMDATGFAASTMATDGRRVYAIFANGDLGAFDFEGNLRWNRSLGIPKNAYGHASSLTTHQDRLLVQFDQGSSGSDGLSRLFALDVANGETVWEVERENPNSWPTPIVIQVGDQEQVITGADPFLIAYSADDGAEIWRADCLGGDVGPSPVYADGIVFAVNEVPGVTAIAVDGAGDVTETKMLWDGFLGAPDCCSPIATDQFLLLLSSDGFLTCYDAKQGGDPVWEYEFDDSSFSSSPTLIGNYLYLFDEQGKAFVLEPTLDECREVAENSIGEKCVTSPAIRAGKIYLRGETHLICIGTE